MLPQLTWLNWKGEGLEKGERVGKGQCSVMVTCIPCCFPLCKPGPPFCTHPTESPITPCIHHSPSGKTLTLHQLVPLSENKLENVPTGANPVHTFRKFIPGGETSPVVQLKAPGIAEPTAAPHSSGSAPLTGGDRSPPRPVCLAWHKTDHPGERITNQ